MSSDVVVEAVFISVAEAAARISTSPDTIRRRVADGTLPAYRIAGTRGIRMRVCDVDALCEPIDIDGYAHAVGGDA